MEKNDNKKKLSTGIKGLDDLFYGGIQLEHNAENHDGLLILARGEHGVNKIHLAMQMCEGFYISQDKKETNAFKEFDPLSYIINDSFVFDEISVLKMMVIEEATNIIKEYVKKQMEKDNKWGKVFDKYNKDIMFAHYCATKYIEETLNDKEFLKSLWNERYGLVSDKSKKRAEKTLENAINSYDTSLLRLFVAEETKDNVLKTFSSGVKEWVKQNGNDNDKKELRKFNKETAIYPDIFENVIEEILKKNSDAVNLFMKTEDKEAVGKNILQNILEGDENNYGKKLVEINQESKNNNESKKHNSEKILFISLNKDGESLKSKYYDFYIKRLIRNIKSNNKFLDSSVELLQRMVWYVDDSCCERDNPKDGYCYLYGLTSITGCKPNHEQTVVFTNHIRSSFIYYNERTHGFHLRHQNGAPDTCDMLLCKLFVPEDSFVKIIGRDELNKGNRMADGLTSFNNLLTIIDKYLPKNNEKKKLDYIMVDGLSRLTKEEIMQCPFYALSDKLRKTCKIGFFTADEKIQSSEINTDIVIDMAIRERTNPDQLYNALRISKCLYQRNVYGWHSYKMRMAGIEVIPSIHFQLLTRYLMDDAVAYALMPIDEDPYSFWLNESDMYNDEKIKNCDFYNIHYEIKKQIEFNKYKSALKGVLNPDKTKALNIIMNEIKSKDFDGHNFLFIDLNYNRTEFKHKYYRMIERINKNNQYNIHLFNFKPGYLLADEFMWAIDQQVQALSSNNKKQGDHDLHYERTHLIIGDLNYMNFAYPCLNKEGLLLPALATYTKKHHMINYVYASVPSGTQVKLLDKETEIIRQMWAVIGTDNMIKASKIKQKQSKEN